MLLLGVVFIVAVIVIIVVGSIAITIIWVMVIDV